MRPWKVRAPRHHPPTQRLPQWGHGLEAVERGGDPPRRPPAPRPQWGHGLEAVERSACGGICATALMPQWGHGLEAVESGPFGRRVHVETSAAMGPRP